MCCCHSTCTTASNRLHIFHGIGVASSLSLPVEQAQAQEQDLEGAKNVHKMLHSAKTPMDGGLVLRGDESDPEFGDEDDNEDEGGDADRMDVGNEEGEVEEI